MSTGRMGWSAHMYRFTTCMSDCMRSSSDVTADGMEKQWRFIRSGSRRTTSSDVTAEGMDRQSRFIRSGSRRIASSDVTAEGIDNPQRFIGRILPGEILVRGEPHRMEPVLGIAEPRLNYQEGSCRNAKCDFLRVNKCSHLPANRAITCVLYRINIGSGRRSECLERVPITARVEMLRMGVIWSREWYTMLYFPNTCRLSANHRYCYIYEYNTICHTISLLPFTCRRGLRKGRRPLWPITWIVSHYLTLKPILFGKMIFVWRDERDIYVQLFSTMRQKTIFMVNTSVKTDERMCG